MKKPLSVARPQPKPQAVPYPRTPTTSRGPDENSVFADPNSIRPGGGADDTGGFTPTGNSSITRRH